ATPAAVGAPAVAPVLAARLARCERDRAAFVGSMPALAGTERMEMRFELQGREPGEGWRHLEAPTFDEWERSGPRRSGFVYAKRLAGLEPGTRYRALVRFRWLDGDGVVQRRARRLSPACLARPGATGREGTRATIR
ncbi:MAG: hypothetical protein M3P39_02840, partial [Actinomycetota bacterium]|nr:hypothetical protein [Actinomycetota bacterium]